MPSKSFIIKPFKVSVILGSIAAFLVVFSTSLWYFPTRFKWDIGNLFSLFFVDREKNFPTMYSALLLVLCAVILFVIASIKHKQPGSYYPHWLGLAYGFLLMACDEFVMLHELFIKPMTEVLGKHRNDLLHFSWVVVGIAVVVLVGLIYLRFLIKLPRRTMWLFIIAGVIYISGAVGMEMAGGIVVKVFGEMTREYIIASALEESLEFAGTVLFIYGLLDYLNHQVSGIQLNFKTGTEQAISQDVSFAKEESKL